MCSIVGLQGNFKADDLIAMLKTSKNRGKDASGIFLDGKIQKGIDLNDLKQVNNEFGYQEGDTVIKAAANILINNQLKNTDILRTDGNEFIIYMVGYPEEQVVLYMRKLYKLMKELPHEKGATLGYSMILNDIKLIEDAINDAVLDIKKSKENKGK